MITQLSTYLVKSWLVVQNLKIARSRGFIFPEAFRLTLVKGIVRIKNVELRPLIKARREKREVVSDWTKSVDQSKTEALVRDFQRVDKLLFVGTGLVEKPIKNRSASERFSARRQAPFCRHRIG